MFINCYRINTYSSSRGIYLSPWDGGNLGFCGTVYTDKNFGGDPFPLYVSLFLFSNSFTLPNCGNIIKERKLQ